MEYHYKDNRYRSESLEDRISRLRKLGKHVLADWLVHAYKEGQLTKERTQRDTQ